jgi:hypothetical protein
MIVGEAGHAHVMKFLPVSSESVNFCCRHCYFLGEKWGDEGFIIFF